MSANNLVRTTAAEVPTLRQLRHGKGLSLEAVELLSAIGDDDGVDVSTSSRIERGLCEPTRRTVVKLARAYDVSVRTMVAVVRRSAEAAVTEQTVGK